MMELEGMRQTCPNHRRVCIISARVSIPVPFPISSSEMVLDQYILRVRRRSLVWNTSRLRWIATVVIHNSVPYKRTLNTVLLKILVMLWTLRFVVFHTGFCMVKAWLTLLILVLVSWSQLHVVVTLVPK